MRYPVMVIRAILFLSIGASADILVQPGYGQPHPVMHQYASAPKAVAQPAPSAPLANNAYQLSALPYGQSVAPYYLEVQPVYHDQSQTQNQMVGYPHWHRPHLPPTHHAPHHLHYSKIGGYSVRGPSVFVGQPQVPLAVHNRRRRSAARGPISGGETAQNKQDDVAKESTLTDTLSPINYAENQGNEHTKDLNDKYLEARLSKTEPDIAGSTLLGLNPAKMIPSNQNLPEDETHQSQTRHIGTHHKPHGTGEIVGLKLKSHQPSLTGVPEKENHEQIVGAEPTNQQFKSGGANWRIITPEGQVMELSPTSPRSFPDPRPIKPKLTKDKVVLQMSNPTELNNNDALEPDPIVGTSKLHQKLQRLHDLKHHHSLPIAPPPSYAHYDDPQTLNNCNCPTYTPQPNYVVVKSNADCYSSLPQNTVAQTSSPLYQISYAPQTTAPAPSTSYVILPQSTVCNPLVNYAATSPLTFYV